METYNLLDSKKNRVFHTTIIGKTYTTIVEISGIKPIIIADRTKMLEDYTLEESILEEKKVREMTSGLVFTDLEEKKVGEMTSEVEPSGADDDTSAYSRFTPITIAKSPTTKNYIIFLYDRKYRDIIYFPAPLDYKVSTTNVDFIYYKGFIYGSHGDNEFLYINYIFDVTSPTYDIPEPNARIASTTRLVGIPSLTPLDSDSGGVNTFEYISGRYNIQTVQRGLGICIDLGPVNSIFNDKTAGLPVYLLRQGGLSHCDYIYCGIKSISELDNQNIYLIQRF